MGRLGSDLGGKKIVHLTLSEDVVVLQGELKIKEKADKWKTCWNSGMAHLK